MASRGPQLLAGWGRASATAARVSRPSDADEVAALFDLSGHDGAPTGMHGGLIARGLGRSYGDAAQCAGGVVVETARLGGISWVDEAAGLVEVGAGVSMQELMAWALPAGWFVPVTPGTRSVSVGGAIAADIHGKNHHRDGSFCRHVTGCQLVTPAGTWEIGPGRDQELFWATAGGMGLTGVVTRATLRLIPVETTSMVVDTLRFDDLDAVMSAMEAGDRDHRYSVAWVDCSGRGRRLGRSVLTRGDHATRGDLQPGGGEPVRTAPGEPRVAVPFPAPGGVLNAVAVRAFNELWFRLAPRHRAGAVQPLASFFHPLDTVARWNLLYGRRGFVQYQFVVPSHQGEAVRRAVTWIGASGLPSFLAVLKRFGPGSPGPLSFPIEGWTLALDFPIGPPGLPELLDRLDALVASSGGRVYLAKDSRLAPELLAVMYPRLPELASVRQRVDPTGRLRSDLSRRLGLDPAGAPTARRGNRGGHTYG